MTTPAPTHGRKTGIIQQHNAARLPPLQKSRNEKKRQIINLAFSKYGVDEGDRTLDNGSHNPVLYQLSYAHHIAFETFNITTSHS